MPDWLRVALGRYVGLGIGALAAYLSLHYGVVVDAKDQAALVTGALVILNGVATGVRLFIDAHVNPTNAASPKVAKIEKQEADAMAARMGGE